MKSPLRRILAPLLVTLAATVALTGAPAGAAPPPSAVLRANEIDEGGTAELRAQLNAASKGFIEAKAALDRSTKRQKQLADHLKTIEAELASRSETVGQVANRAYRMGRLERVSALLDGGSPAEFLDRAAALTTVAASEESKVRELVATRDRERQAQAALAKEIAEQKKQLAVMQKRKEQAQRALAAAGGGQPVSVPARNSAAASPAPRNADGSWPNESCSVPDPTTSGCLTPRTAHALRQAQAAGFTRFVACFRNDGGPGEHPLGRACDFAAQPNGFGGVATGGDRTYGDNLAAYFINNADRLGVLYVIWFKRIWLPGSGWQTYQHGRGDPSSDHTNHVHLSVV